MMYDFVDGSGIANTIFARLITYVVASWSIHRAQTSHATVQLDSDIANNKYRHTSCIYVDVVILNLTVLLGRRP